jgi:hypothetical protein
MAPLNLDQTESISFVNILGHKLTKLPITYLGVLLHRRKYKKKKHWDISNNKIEKRMSSWKGKLLSYFFECCFISNPIFWMSVLFFKVPVNVRKQIDRMKRIFMVKKKAL